MSRLNNFDLLRLLAAAGVMALHLGDLSAQPALGFLTWLEPKIWLSTFFVISGYLVYMSCETTPSLRLFASKRLRRIVPAYAVVVLTCALAGAWLSTLPPEAYFGRAWAQYLVANLTFLNFVQPSLPGVFASNPFAGAPVNGALWTIKVELMFYLVMPAIVALVRRFGHHTVLGLGFIASCLWWGGFLHLAQVTGKASLAELSKQMPGQLMFFLPGAWCYCERERLRQMGWRLGIVAVVMMSLAWHWPQTGPTPGAFIYPLGLALGVFWAACNLPHLGAVTRHGDFSYGIYLWHFPVIQALVQLGAFRASPYLGLTLAVLTVGSLAWLTWHLVEAPALRAGRPVRLAVS
jgi:peptidoglycan/LPS O-acetylase OafA/YrhL